MLGATLFVMMSVITAIYIRYLHNRQIEEPDVAKNAWEQANSWKFGNDGGYDTEGL